ncbi:MAG: tetratricopeptide repeat protein [Hyphomicrobiales bacterium]|nr:MAG: tetratricopeptide repeat protein [Hyphomicrobiales bacterium]
MTGDGNMRGRRGRFVRLGSWLAAAAVAATVLSAPPRLALGADEGQVEKARDAAALLVRGNIDQAINLYTEALEDRTLPNDRRATLYNDRGVAYARLGRHREAIEDYNRAVHLYPEFAAVYNNRGNVLLGLGATREAIKDFDRAIALAPGYAAAFSNRAGAYIKTGQADKALADYARAIELTPSSPAALNGRGRAHLAAFRPHAAIRDFTRAVNTDQRFGPAYRSRGEAKLSVEQYDGAIEDFSRAIAFEPRNAEIYALRGTAYLEAENWASAIKDYTTAVELAPNQAGFLALRGFAHAKAEAYEESLNDLAKAIELDPKAALPYAFRSWTYRLQQETDLAAREADRALKLDPESPEAYWARGEVNAALGRADQAAADYRKAVELGSRFKDAKRSLNRLGLAPFSGGAEVPGAGRDGWRVHRQGRQFVALSDDYPRLRINLEMIGEEMPQIVEWQVKAPPFDGIGVLRFKAGTIETPRGPETVEHAAIVDLTNATVVSVQVNRQGPRQARWTWEEGRVLVASADGTTDELQLRQMKPKEQPAPKRYVEPKKTINIFDFFFKFKF